MQHPAKVRPPRGRGRRLAVILVGASLALATALVLLLPSIRRWFPKETLTVPSREITYRLLSQGDAETLDTVTVAHLAGDGYVLQYLDGALRLRRGDELLDLNDETADELLEAATSLTVTDTVTDDAAEVAQHLGDMGLEPPKITVTVRYTNGREDVLEIGASVPETSYSYYRWSGDAGVHMCDEGVSNVFSLSENQLLPIEQPVLAKTLVDHVTLRRRDATYGFSFSTDAAGYTAGALEEPYAYPMSADGVTTVLTALENLRLGATEDRVTAENRAAYGLDNPLCVVGVHQSAGARNAVDANGQLYSQQLSEQQLRFTFGRAEGDYFYTCEYEGGIYLVSRFLVQALITGDPDGWITTTPACMEGAELSAVAVQTGMGSADIRVARTERVLANNQLEVDSSGNVVFDTRVTLNGEEIPLERFDALMTRLNAMSISGAVPQDWSYGGASPRWQLALTTTGGTVRTIAAYAMDAFSDALVVDGVMKHYIYVEALATALGDFLPSAQP